MSSVIMGEKALDRALSKMSSQILDENSSEKDLVFIGIREKGFALAKRLACKIKKSISMDVAIGMLDTTMYRDDLSMAAQQPVLCQTDLSFDVSGKEVILVDDVLYTGRTVRAAMDGIMDLGRPKLIRLAVLVDRGHRELPIQYDYVGRVVITRQSEIIKLVLKEISDEKDSVLLIAEDENL